MITAEMIRLAPDPCYPCASCMAHANPFDARNPTCNPTCYPDDMIGYVAHQNAWHCSICIEELGHELIPGNWSEDESEWIEDTPPQWDEVTPMPAPCYACDWEDCGAERTFAACDLRWFHGAFPNRPGYFCAEHWKRYRAKVKDSYVRESPTLAEVLRGAVQG